MFSFQTTASSFLLTFILRLLLHCLSQTFPTKPPRSVRNFYRLPHYKYTTPYAASTIH
ncbi:hypothetical protein V6Z11_A05G088900 [Gossypium hirsutum]